MSIYINENLINNNKELIEDPGIVDAAKIWGLKDLTEKSAIHLSEFETPFNSISLLYGPRQVGKTSSLKLFLSKLQDSETIVFQDCSAIVDRRDLYDLLRKLIRGRTTIVLDEVQATPEWHMALRALYGEGALVDARIWCTGSEGRHLIESGERLPGRKGKGRVLFARPWNFREFVALFFPQIELSDLPALHQVNQSWFKESKLDLSDAWKAYRICGGFPLPSSQYLLRGSIPDETFQVYIDWILGAWTRLRTPERSLRQLCHRVTESLNSRTSFDRLKVGTDIASGNTVKALLQIQEDYFSIRPLSRYSAEEKRFLLSKQRKIYPLDPFVAHVFRFIGLNIRRNFRGQMDESFPMSLDETTLYSQTLRLEHPLEVGYLYNSKSQAEVDFFMDNSAVELKSQGKPSKGQRQILDQTKRPFCLRGSEVPLLAYMLSEAQRPTC